MNFFIELKNHIKFGFILCEIRHKPSSFSLRRRYVIGKNKPDSLLDLFL